MYIYKTPLTSCLRVAYPMLSSNMLFNNILKHILVIRLKEEKVNFGTEMLENAVPTPGTTVKNPQSLTSEKTKKLWSRVFLSHHICMKPHLAAANSASEEKSCAGCWQEPSSWQGLARIPPPPSQGSGNRDSSTREVPQTRFFWSSITGSVVQGQLQLHFFY